MVQNVVAVSRSTPWSRSSAPPYRVHMGKRGIDWFFRSRETGKITIAQVPNLSLALFVVLRIAQVLLSPHGAARDALTWAGTGVLGWWAVTEICRGVNPFRRVLGTAVLIFLVVQR